MRLLHEVLKGSKLGVYGFGNEFEPVPYVIAFSTPTAQGELAKAIVERRVTGVNAIQLGTFRRDDHFREDMQMYGRVLLHSDVALNGEAPTGWVMDYQVSADIVKKHEDMYRRHMRAIPADFEDATFKVIAEYARADKFLKPADDRARLSRMRGGQ
jgi:hypothetical protein